MYYKFRDLKVYGSSESLANELRKYRRVYDKSEVSYIYVELSLFNKLVDERDWNASINLKAYHLNGSKKKELCNISLEKTIPKHLPVVYFREGWGYAKKGFYWKKGEYVWEAQISGVLVATQKFFIEDVGVVSEEFNPCFTITGIKLYEGAANNVPPNERVYGKVFDEAETRYLFAELHIENLINTGSWNCELCLRFRNNTHQLKAEVSELVMIKPEQDKYICNLGWGTNEKGFWLADKYYLEVIFMDTLVAVLPFEVSTFFDEGMNEIILPGTGGVIINSEQHEATSLEEVMQNLDSLIGLQNVKTRIKEYAEYLKFIKIRIEKGFDEKNKLNLHAIFTGNPGTGKTTVVKMLGQIYKQMGLLSKGDVLEVDRADLVGEYIGQTAPRVKEAIKLARGGILFIDEAYSMARSKDDSKDFGKEVIEILVKEMSDGAGDLAVVVAGYPSEMRTFLDANPGLKSRFNQWFEFADYVPQELADIAQFAAEKRDILISPQAKTYLYDKIVESYRTRDRFFGNGRYINSLIERAKINLGLRVMKLPNPRQLSREELSTLTLNDIELIFKKKDLLQPDIPIDENLLLEALAELNALIGLNAVKQEINELVKLVRFHRETGKEVLNKFSLHSVFLGNPGTGKTTVARILANIYKALGVLERGHLVETDRHGLVAGYVGQTAIKTAEAIDQAIGGVLFIDEAYALSTRGQNDFGAEAIETLIKRMEDQKGLFAVVAAGYTDNMNHFIESNPGIKSRIDRILTFEDYNANELLAIAINYLHTQKYVIETEAEQQLKIYFEYLYNTKDKFFGNARTVIKTLEEVIKNQNLRLASVPANERSIDILKAITLADVILLDAEKIESSGLRKRLGFRSKQV